MILLNESNKMIFHLERLFSAEHPGLIIQIFRCPNFWRRETYNDDMYHFVQLFSTRKTTKNSFVFVILSVE